MTGERLAVSAALLLLGCTIDAGSGAGAQLDVARNECSSSRDCEGVSGACMFGACVAHEGELSTVLLEVVPPTSTPRIGGVSFLVLAENAARSGDAFRVELPVLASVHGFVPTYKGCEAGTFAAEVTLTPRETSFGFPTVSYVTRTHEGVVADEPPPAGCTAPGTEPPHLFHLDVPPGNYDLYVRPLEALPVPAGGSDGGAAPDCMLVPELVRTVSTIEEGAVCQGLPVDDSGHSPAPAVLDLVVQWSGGNASLDGWTVDMVHPKTGQILSDRVRLEGPPDPEVKGYKVALRHSAVVDPTVSQGQELVRLSPPDELVAPVIQFVKSGLEATAPAKTPTLSPFPRAVSFEGSLYRESGHADGPEWPVQADVGFIATSLEGIDSGLFASFTTTGQVTSEGRLTAELLPGEYRVRVDPFVGSGLASTELPLVISCKNSSEGCVPNGSTAPKSVHAGWLGLVPSAAKVTGTVTSPLGGRVDQVRVDALPPAITERHCPADMDAGACAETPLGVLDKSLGEQAFAPRSTTTLAKDGRFTLEVDCGECKPDRGALFDIAVRPPEGSRLPWRVQPGVSIATDTAFGDVRLSLPVIQRGVVEVPQTAAEALRVGSALIRAYVLLDQSGAPLLDPEGVPSCVDQPAAAAGAPCIRSVVKIAESRAAEDGTFELVLPSTMD